MELYINGVMVDRNDYEKFAWDGCHKIYLCTHDQEFEASNFGYDLFYLEELPRVWNESCPLRFIQNWGLDFEWVRQCQSASFEWREF